MKFLVLLSFFVVFAAATPVEERWRRVKNPMENPKYFDFLSKLYSQQNFIENPLRGGRIVGGSVASTNQFPFQIYGYYDDSWLCGGSLISNTFILTAAHCVYQMSVAELFIGSIDRRFAAPFETTVSSSNFYLHESYNDISLINDIAVIRTPQIPTDNANIGIVPIPSRSEAALNLAGATLTVSGFGLYSDSSDFTSANLLFVTAPVITNTVCARTFGTQYVRDSNLCIDGANGRGTCGGDSGGPGTILLSGRAVQVGVVSYGAAAGCELGYPDVFTRVGSYLDWISSKTGIVIN